MSIHDDMLEYNAKHKKAVYVERDDGSIADKMKYSVIVENTTRKYKFIPLISGSIRITAGLIGNSKPITVLVKDKSGNPVSVLGGTYNAFEEYEITLEDVNITDPTTAPKIHIDFWYTILEKIIIETGVE